jgi:predicted Rossmann fold nucleotide-binding protein DprA/Smf involved in DNA uptake
MFKVIIAGSRDFSDYNFLKEKLDILLKDIEDDIEIVSGTARGADQLGERYAIERNYKIAYFKPDWSIGLSAGYKRNEDMAKYADACVVFWVNDSKGSKHMIDISQKHNLKLRIYKF